MLVANRLLICSSNAREHTVYMWVRMKQETFMCTLLRLAVAHAPLHPTQAQEIVLQRALQTPGCSSYPLSIIVVTESTKIKIVLRLLCLDSPLSLPGSPDRLSLPFYCSSLVQLVLFHSVCPLGLLQRCR